MLHVLQVESSSVCRSMPEEFGPLMEDVAELAWATEAFGEPPEATNLWVGGQQSVTSFHKVRGMLPDVGMSTMSDGTV